MTTMTKRMAPFCGTVALLAQVFVFQGCGGSNNGLTGTGGAPATGTGGATTSTGGTPSDRRNPRHGRHDDLHRRDPRHGRRERLRSADVRQHDRRGGGWQGCRLHRRRRPGLLQDLWAREDRRQAGDLRWNRRTPRATVRSTRPGPSPATRFPQWRTRAVRPRRRWPPAPARSPTAWSAGDRSAAVAAGTGYLDSGSNAKTGLLRLSGQRDQPDLELREQHGLALPERQRLLADDSHPRTAVRRSARPEPGARQPNEPHVVEPTYTNVLCRPARRGLGDLAARRLRLPERSRQSRRSSTPAGPPPT